MRARGRIEVTELAGRLRDAESELSGLHRRLEQSARTAREAEEHHWHHLALLQPELDERTRHVVGLEQRLARASVEMERVKVDLTRQAARLGERLRAAQDHLNDREGRVLTLSEQLEEASTAARGIRLGVELYTARLEQELERMRTGLAWRMLDRCEQAARRLLPSGSRRRAAYDRMVAMTRKEAQPPPPPTTPRAAPTRAAGGPSAGEPGHTRRRPEGRSVSVTERRRCEQRKARRGSISGICNRGATPRCDADPRFPDRRQTVRPSRQAGNLRGLDPGLKW